MTKFNKIIRKKTEKQLIAEFISLFKSYVAKKEKLNQRFTFVLTGGPSPINLYKSLSKVKINWKNIDLFWGDERFVSQRSNNSNFQLAKKYLLNKIDIDKKNIFEINTNKSNVDRAAEDYGKKIKNYFKKKKIIFDLILLGMGEDGHIASIFSNNTFGNKKISISVIRQDFNRITLNLKIINKAKKIALWLNTKKVSFLYKKLKKKKNIPVNYLDKRKKILFSIK